MTEAIWIDRGEQLEALAHALASQESIGVDTEFLRERTFFPKLCLLQLSAAGQVWLVDTLRVGSLEPLMPALTAGHSRKLIHAARQDLEALYLTSKQVVSPVFDTQIAAACIGLKPQVGYAELVKTLLDVTIPKGQTRTDWSMRPLTRAQLEYAADDVLHLQAIAIELTKRLRALGREHWVREDCLGLSDLSLYEPDAAFAWARLRGLGAIGACAARPRQDHCRMAGKSGARARPAARLDFIRRRHFFDRGGQSDQRRGTRCGAAAERKAQRHAARCAQWFIERGAD